jgi:hypothetical protein
VSVTFFDTQCGKRELHYFLGRYRFRHVGRHLSNATVTVNGPRACSQRHIVRIQFPATADHATLVAMEE